MHPTGLLEARWERLHGVMAGYVDRNEVPGVVTLVARHSSLRVADEHSSGVDQPLLVTFGRPSSLRYQHGEHFGACDRPHRIDHVLRRRSVEY
jgi:hypothetical protein